jgi:hypothetical protein
MMVSFFRKKFIISSFYRNPGDVFAGYFLFYRSY